ncbi:hypothetical protein SEVIR_4G231300v4 [Setaria viridis]|uniref:Uncharacterized protein n=1 Tax=Setaria viridis TaxID=4556 RepID=A0A4U6V3P6_SETVI|nr:hypothetical protein SEVIR_4G231300v2 [Setaria viridis]
MEPGGSLRVRRRGSMPPPVGLSITLQLLHGGAVCRCVLETGWVDREGHAFLTPRGFVWASMSWPLPLCEPKPIRKATVGRKSKAKMHFGLSVPSLLYTSSVPKSVHLAFKFFPAKKII